MSFYLNLEWLWDIGWKLSRPAVKVVLHWWFGVSEVERVCAGNKIHTSSLSLQFSQSIYRSKKLSVYSKIIFFHRPFSVKAAADNIIEHKRITAVNKYVLANLTLALRDLRCINIMITSLEKTRKTVYDCDNKSHAQHLMRLWDGLFGPEQRFPGSRGPEWSLAGFQGNDPGTDFRGMGLLALHQLAHFASSPERGVEARQCLKISCHETRYFPFAATGVVMTSFMLDLLRENRLHPMLFEAIQKSCISAANPSLDGYQQNSNNYEAAELVENASAAELSLAKTLSVVLHDYYCTLYASFCDQWLESRPKSIMDFPPIFAAFQKRTRSSLPPLG